MDPLSSAVAGINAQSVALDQISANIANAQTVGYKRTDTGFSDLVADGESTPNLGGVTAWTSSTAGQQGSITSSYLSTAMAIQGDGFFVVQNASGTGADAQTLYTRRGDFQLDKDGHLVNGVGQALEGTGVDPSTGQASGGSPQLIQIRSSTAAQNGQAAGKLTGVSVADGGIVQATYDNGRTVNVAKVTLAGFNSETNLRQADGGAFAPTQLSGNAIIGASGSVVGGSVENSNTDVATEFSKLIEAQQAYSASTQIVTIANDMTQNTLSLIK